jgi:hypothetical protein
MGLPKANKKNDHATGSLSNFCKLQLGSGLIDYSQKMTMAAMQIADMNV